MKRLLLALGFCLGLAASAWAVVGSTVINNAAYTILSTDTRVVTGPTAFTASRTWTLPSAGATCVGQTCGSGALDIIDLGNAVSTNTPLVIAPASSETINGSTSNITLTAVGVRVSLVPTSGSAWSMAIMPPIPTNAAGTLPTVFHTGNSAPVAVSSGTDATAVNTQTVITEIFIPIQTTLTGVKWLGLATSTGNVQFSLADSTGKVIAAAQTASTATAGTANYQTAAFAATYLANPGKYFILMQNSGSNHYRAWPLGNFGASVKTGETFGTFTNVTAPTTLTADVGLIADVY